MQGGPLDVGVKAIFRTVTHYYLGEVAEMGVCPVVGGWVLLTQCSIVFGEGVASDWLSGKSAPQEEVFIPARVGQYLRIGSVVSFTVVPELPKRKK